MIDDISVEPDNRGSDGPEVWDVFRGDEWLASFKNKEDAHDFADLTRLRP